MGKQWKQWLTLFLGAPKITANGDCSHEIKKCLFLGRKVMTNFDSILKSRDITLPTKVCRRLWFFLWSCMDVRVGLWRRLSAKNWCFWTVVLEKTLESPLDCKELSPEYSLEGLMLKLKLQYFATWCEELTHLKRAWCWDFVRTSSIVYICFYQDS